MLTAKDAKMMADTYNNLEVINEKYLNKHLHEILKEINILSQLGRYELVGTCYHPNEFFTFMPYSKKQKEFGKKWLIKKLEELGYKVTLPSLFKPLGKISWK